MAPTRQLKEPARPTAPHGATFADALHAAIEASGLSLDRIRHALDARGVRISVTTLSYWRRGRSQPERAPSMLAVKLLEEVLELPTGALSALLGPPRPRGRYATAPPAAERLHPTELWPGEQWIAEVCEELEVTLDDDLERLSIHDVLQVPSGPGECVLRMNQVVRAGANGVSRCLVVHAADEDTDELPRIGAVRHARLGRVRHQPTTRIVAAELLLDAPLSIGDTAVFAYEVRFTADSPATCYGRRFAVPVRQYVLQVQFTPGAAPAHCYRYERDPGSDADRARHQLWLGASASAHLVSLDQQPGHAGIRWEWQ
ncbi:hypothetical protein JS756_32190 [Streptomyces actuosus]|uniref:XRE family transcriptional regulator n=1 Tax=Streptomyces actuosus TaxID=1885 RepID=A0ABS2VZU9_STRAS|nr:hypothetical protein [Streptomyces actuosus]MBN0048671.1 hypothetical protein [Streptomyces actuosus]